MSKIIADSCCDMTPEMKEEMGIISIPLTMMLGGKEFSDDENLDIDAFMEDMETIEGKRGSAAPSPFAYQEAVETAGDAYIITLSKKLSASYDNAVLGAAQAQEANKDVRVHVFDSKSASAGETLIALKLHELIQDGMPRESIIETISRFIDNMKTYFALENYNNLQKNGRLGKVKGTLIKLINLRLIMGADGNGEIALFGKCRKKDQLLERFISLIESRKESKGENIVISHCYNHSFAAQLKDKIKERFNFKEIYIVKTGGLSSLYADNGGIILAF